MTLRQCLRAPSPPKHGHAGFAIAMFATKLQTKNVSFACCSRTTDDVSGRCHHNEGGQLASIVEKISLLRNGLSTAEDLLQAITEALEQTVVEVRVIDDGGVSCVGTRRRCTCSGIASQLHSFTALQLYSGVCLTTRSCTEKDAVTGVVVSFFVTRAN